MPFHLSSLLARFSLLLGLAMLIEPALAEKIGNRVAVFTGLDKITGRIITFDVYTDETVQFGALRVTPRVCYTRPATEAAQTDAFVEVDEITLDNQVKRIFSGWMFAASPGLNAVDHPVYDVWLNDCRQTSDIPPPSERGEEARAAQAIVEKDESLLAPGVEMIDGIPIPRKKPLLSEPPLTVDTPADGEENLPAEILD